MIKRKLKYHKDTKKFKASKKSLPIFFGAFLVILNIFYTLQMASLGVKVADLETTLGTLEKENNALESKLVESSSLLQLKEKSTQLGFMKIENSLYIKGEGAFTGFLH